jgi:prevent-host-death family protein
VGAVVSQRELRNDSGAIMRRVEQGESFVVTRNGVPIADLIPHKPDRGPRQRFVPVDDIGRGLGMLPDWGVTQFRAELAECDELVDDTDTDPWSIAR